MCILRDLRNFPMTVLSGGIIFGYFLLACRAFSSSLRAGPGYRGASLRRRWPWDGGVNLVGFSRTRGPLGLGELLAAGLALVEAARKEEGRARHAGSPRGRRKRGMEGGGMVVVDVWC